MATQCIFNLPAPIAVATPSAAWTSRDVSAYVPPGATGIIFHVYNPNATWTRTLGVRINGSGDNRDDSFSNNTHAWGMIGVDANRIFQTKGQWGNGTWTLYLTGYTTAGVTFLTNGVDKTPAAGSWQTIDCSVQAPGAIGLIFEISHDNSLYSLGLRKNGSTDARIFSEYGKNTLMAVIGCDAMQKCQAYISDIRLKLYLVGYITDGAEFNTNAIPSSLTSTGSYIDLPSLPTRHSTEFIEVTSVAPNIAFHLRKDGASDDFSAYSCYYHTWGIIPTLYGSGIEGKINSLDTDFYLIGGATVWVETLAASDISGFAALGNLYLYDSANIDEYGIEWGTASGVYPNDNTTTDDITDGSHSLEITGLSPSTTYYFRAKAHHVTAGWIYGSQVSFTTGPPLPGAKTNPPSAVGGTSSIQTRSSYYDNLHIFVMIRR